MKQKYQILYKDRNTGEEGSFTMSAYTYKQAKSYFISQHGAQYTIKKVNKILENIMG